MSFSFSFQIDVAEICRIQGDIERVVAKSSVSWILQFHTFRKVKGPEGVLKNWNIDVFGKVETNKKEALRRVSYWGDLEKERELNLEEAEGRVNARVDFKWWALAEEISWRQKSRETWLKEGDRNTGFFHRTANAHRRRNYINSISINERKLEKEA